MFFFTNFKIKILISNFFVGNTPLGLPVKETFNDILLSCDFAHTPGQSLYIWKFALCGP